ncbi:MAG: cupin [Alphaproteobacteria bacterium]|nr:cupin [Alphaproteobacteria bacterium]
MATLEVHGPEGRRVVPLAEGRPLLERHGLTLARWAPDAPLPQDPDPDTILEAYAHKLGPLMAEGGYATADVIRVGPGTPNLDAVRAKFLTEHVHTEPEVRFFVEGKGLFWFHPEGDPVFALLCEAGDLISVPANMKHWFDMGAAPRLTAIRVFTNVEGWVPHNTGSGVAEGYNRPYGEAL